MRRKASPLHRRVGGSGGVSPSRLNGKEFHFRSRLRNGPACWGERGSDPKNEGAADRLSVLEKSRDGFVIAEEDLRRRGPGDLSGTAQSGFARLRLGDLLADSKLIKLARQLAERLIAQDPTLSINPEPKSPVQSQTPSLHISRE